MGSDAFATEGRNDVTLSHWWQILTLYEVIIVWPLAFVALLLLFRAKTLKARVAYGATLVLIFAPFIHRWIGDLYFDYLCEHKAGEFIYRTVDNVEGVLQMRPRDGSKDYFDRMAAGDIPEDPWGHTNAEARYPWTFLGHYEFFETRQTEVSNRISMSKLFHSSMKATPDHGQSIVRYYGYNGRDLSSFRKLFAQVPRSTYGYTWTGSRSPLDIWFNVFPGEIRVVDLEEDETLAFLRGFYRSRPVNICPSGKSELFVLRFLEKVLRPKEGKREAS